MAKALPQLDFIGDEVARPEVLSALVALEATKKRWNNVVAYFAIAPLAEWADKTYGPVVARASWWGWLTGKPNRNHIIDDLPGDNHVEYRQASGGRRVRISQPFHLRWHQLRGLVAHCEANGLEVSIHGRSWWYPTQTIVVEIGAAKP